MSVRDCRWLRWKEGRFLRSVHSVEGEGTSSHISWIRKRRGMCPQEQDTYRMLVVGQGSARLGSCEGQPCSGSSTCSCFNRAEAWQLQPMELFSCLIDTAMTSASARILTNRMRNRESIKSRKACVIHSLSIYYLAALRCIIVIILIQDTSLVVVEITCMRMLKTVFRHQWRSHNPVGHQIFPEV